MCQSYLLTASPLSRSDLVQHLGSVLLGVPSAIDFVVSKSLLLEVVCSFSLSLLVNPQSILSHPPAHQAALVVDPSTANVVVERCIVKRERERCRSHWQRAIIFPPLVVCVEVVAYCRSPPSPFQTPLPIPLPPRS